MSLWLILLIFTQNKIKLNTCSLSTKGASFLPQLNLLFLIHLSWRRKVCSYATYCTWWQTDSYFFAKNTPAPSDKSCACYVPVKFMLGTFIWLMILLLILVPGCLQHPSIETNSLETWMLSYTNWSFSNLPHVYCLPVFVADFRKLWTAGAFLISVEYLAIFSCTPKVNKLCLTWIIAQ